MNSIGHEPLRRRLGVTWGIRPSISVGVALGLGVILFYAIGMFWGRAALVGKAMLLVPPALLFLRHPIAGVLASAFIVASGLNTIMPGVLPAAAMGTAVVVLYRKLYSGDLSWVVSPFALLSGLLFTWMAVTFLWSPFQLFYDHERVIYTMPLLVVIPELVRSPREFRWLIAALGLGMMVTAVSSIFGVYTLFSQGLAVQAAGSVEGLTVARYYGHWEGPNNLGHAMMPLIVLTAAYLRELRTLGQRLFFVLALGSGVLAIALSMSRAAILSLMVASLMLIFHARRRWTILLVSATVIVLAFAFLPVDLVGRLESLMGRKRDASFAQRSQVLEMSGDMIAESFPLGLGWSGFHYRQDDFNKFGWYRTGHAHNNLVHLMVETGVIGVILYLFAFFVPLFMVWRWNPSRGSPESEWLSYLRISLVAMWVGLLVASLFEYTVAWPAHWLALLLMSMAPAVFGKVSS